MIIWMVSTFAVFITAECIQLGTIKNAAITEVENVFSMNGTWAECVCTLVRSNGSISGLNYFQTNGTCQLFYNYTPSSQVQMSLNSFFIFSKLPPVSPQMSTSNELLGLPTTSAAAIIKVTTTTTSTLAMMTTSVALTSTTPYSCTTLPSPIFSIIKGVGTTTTYQLYTNTFMPNKTVITVTFAFQVDDAPGTWSLDDVSLKQTVGVELMQNGGFESGTLAPAWIRSCTAQCTGLSGQGSGGGPGHISNNGSAHSGTYYYIDRCNPEPNFDYLSQTIAAVTINQSCILTYYLSLLVNQQKTHNNFYVMIS